MPVSLPSAYDVSDEEELQPKRPGNGIIGNDLLNVKAAAQSNYGTMARGFGLDSLGDTLDSYANDNLRKVDSGILQQKQAAGQLDNVVDNASGYRLQAEDVATQGALQMAPHIASVMFPAAAPFIEGANVVSNIALGRGALKKEIAQQVANANISDVIRNDPEAFDKYVELANSDSEDPKADFKKWLFDKQFSIGAQLTNAAISATDAFNPLKVGRSASAGMHALKTGAVETAQETTQSGAEQLQFNKLAQNIDPTVATDKDLLPSMVWGAFGGGLVGGVAGGVQHKLTADTRTEQPTVTDLLADARATQEQTNADNAVIADSINTAPDIDAAIENLGTATNAAINQIDLNVAPNLNSAGIDQTIPEPSVSPDIALPVVDPIAQANTAAAIPTAPGIDTQQAQQPAPEISTSPELLQGAQTLSDVAPAPIEASPQLAEPLLNERGNNSALTVPNALPSEQQPIINDPTGAGIDSGIDVIPADTQASENDPAARKRIVGDTAAPQAEPITPTTTIGELDNGQKATEKATNAGQERLLDQPTDSYFDMPTREVPLDSIKLSEDVPQFKSGSNKDGVVEPLGGSFDRTGVAPVQLWERKDGSLELISGRHRADLARRSGESTIPAQVHREADGFTAQQAAMLDAELNIRDGQGKTKDYANYFKASGITEQDAQQRGLISRTLGKTAFAIANNGTEDLIAAHRNDAISDKAAYTVATTAPNNERVQALGMKAAIAGKPDSYVANLMQAVNLNAASTGQAQQSGNNDLFGFDDSAIQEAEAMAAVATDEQQRLIKLKTAAKIGAKAEQVQGETNGQVSVKIKNPAQLKAYIANLDTQINAWGNWPTNPQLVSQIKTKIEANNVNQTQAAPLDTGTNQPGNAPVLGNDAAISAVQNQTATAPKVKIPAPFWKETKIQVTNGEGIQETKSAKELLTTSRQKTTAFEAFIKCMRGA